MKTDNDIIDENSSSIFGIDDEESLYLEKIFDMIITSDKPVFKLREILAMKSDSDLYNLNDLIGLNIHTKKREILINKIYDSLTNEKILLSILLDTCNNYYHKISDLKEGYIEDDVRFLSVVYSSLGVITAFDTSKGYYVLIAEEIYDVISKLIKEGKLDKIVKNRFLEALLTAGAKTYGLLHIEYIYELTKIQKDYKFSKKEIREYLEFEDFKHGEGHNYQYFRDDSIVLSRFIVNHDATNTIISILNNDNKVLFRPSDFKELQVRVMYDEYSNKYIDDFLMFLVEENPDLETKDIEFIMFFVKNFGHNREARNDVFKIIRDAISFLQKREINEILDRIDIVFDNIPSWQYRGYSKEEYIKLYKE